MKNKELNIINSNPRILTFHKILNLNKIYKIRKISLKKLIKIQLTAFYNRYRCFAEKIMMENNNQFNRRRFLKNSLLAAGGIFIAPLIKSCSDDFANLQCRSHNYYRDATPDE